MNPESRSGESAPGESRLVWLASYARRYKAQSLYTKKRFAKGVPRNITDFSKASITTDGIKIFSITFCTLVIIYCTCKIAKDAFKIVLYVTKFYMHHCAVLGRCSSYRLKTVICLWLKCTMLYATERQCLYFVN